MSEPYRVAIVVGSVRDGRVAPVVGRWFADLLERHVDGAVDLIDLADLDLPDDLGGGGDADAFVDRIRRADAVVVVTPEYNHGYPGALKTAIDTAYEQWFAKPVGFVSYGGSSGGLRAVEQLRAVFAELHVVTMQTGVAIRDVHDAFGPAGELRDPGRVEAAAATMLRQLDWWACTLAEARRVRPYTFVKT